MKNVLSFVLPVVLIAIIQAVVRSSGYMLGAIPTVLLALAAYAAGRKLGEKWEEDHKE